MLFQLYTFHVEIVREVAALGAIAVDDGRHRVQWWCWIWYSFSKAAAAALPVHPIRGVFIEQRANGELNQPLAHLHRKILVGAHLRDKFSLRGLARMPLAGGIALEIAACQAMVCAVIVMENREAFRDALVKWFDRHGKDYPWRRTRDAYAVWVSEVMLQQTQIATVLGKGYYARFLETFPDVSALASADDERLLKAWEGLGYYRRARMLRETARAVITRHGGTFPREPGDLLALPGIGPYTAGALRAFAFDLPGTVVDGNVVRVLARLRNFSAAVDNARGQRLIGQWAEQLEDKQRPRIYNSALMELGQTRCRPGVPDCGACPVAGFCRARDPARLPVKHRKTIITDVDEHALWVRDVSGRVLLHCEDGQRRTGLWKLPTRTAAEISSWPVMAELRYAITRYRVRLRVHAGGAEKFVAQAGEAWFLPETIARLPMPSPFRLVLQKLLGE